VIALDIISRRHGMARKGREMRAVADRVHTSGRAGWVSSGGFCGGHGTGRGRQPMGHDARRGASRDGARQVSAGGRQQETTTRVLQTFGTFARGVSQRSRSIFSAGIEGEDIAA
jgi:hypothetical protein